MKAFYSGGIPIRGSLLLSSSLSLVKETENSLLAFLNVYKLQHKVLLSQHALTHQSS